eukprot:XP_001690693.1 predicted protein [Chlamydomonas reinhardtii]
MQPLFPSQGVKPRQVGSPGPKSIFPAPPLPKPATGSPKRVEPKIEPRVDTGGSSATKAQELAARIQQASINRASSVKKVKDLAAKLVVHAERQEEIRNRTMKKLEVESKDVSQRLNKEQPDALGAPPTPQAKEQADARQRQAGDAVPELSSGVERAKSLASRLIEQVERQDNLCSKALSKLEEYADKLKQPVPSVRPVSVPAPPAPAAAAAPGLGALAAAGTHAAAPAGDGLLPLPLGMMTVDVQAAGPRHSEQSPAEAAAAAPVPAGAQAAQQQPQPGALTDTPQAEAEAAYAPGVVRA